MITAEELYNKLSHITVGANICRFSREICEEYAPLINEINELKKEKNALILAHSYVSPEIIHGVSDHVGDSFELSRAAEKANCDIIIFAAKVYGRNRKNTKSTKASLHTILC